MGDADEEDRQIQKGNELQQKNRESLANSIRMAKEATEVGQDTVMKLTAQKEQMKKMDEDLDKTNESLNRSERVIRGRTHTQHTAAAGSSMASSAAHLLFLRLCCCVAQA